MLDNRFVLYILIISLLVVTVIPPAYAYKVNTHRALSYWAAYRFDSGVEDYLVRELLITNGLESIATGSYGAQSRTLIEWIQEGAEEEDAFTIWPYGYFVNHFYNPVNGLGLNDFYSGIPSGQKTDSMTWAWDGGTDYAGDDENQWSWLKARQSYYAMLINPYEKPMPLFSLRGRNELMGETFRALGHIIHLIQDAAQPQHTRNDAHTDLDGAPFEEFCSAEYGTQGQLESFINASLPEFNYDNLPKNSSRGMPRELMAFWDTKQYRGQFSWTYTKSLGLAEFSSAFFVTDETMFTGQSLAEFPGLTINLQGDILERHKFPNPRLEDTDIPLQLGSGIVNLFRLGQTPPPPAPIPPTIRKFVGLTNIPKLATIDVRPGASGAVGEMFLSSENYSEHAKVLLPRAISYSAGILRYFFRGKLGVQIVPQVDVPGIPGVINSTPVGLIITNLSDEEIRGGVWQLYADFNYTPILRAPLNCLFQPTIPPLPQTQVYNEKGYSGTLAPGQSFTALCNGSYADLNASTQMFTLVYKGTIGNEKNIAIAAKQFRLNDRGLTLPVPRGKSNIRRSIEGRTISP